MGGKRTTWKPGESGNPRGRPRGTGKVAELRAALGEHLPEVVEKLVEAARGGDVQAARVLLDRVLPALKPVEMPVTIPLPGDSLADQGRSVVRAIEQGMVAPSQGAALIGAIGQLARVVEVDELARRIEALEARNGEGGTHP